MQIPLIWSRDLDPDLKFIPTLIIPCDHTDEYSRAPFLDKGHFSRYRDSHCTDKTTMRFSYLYNGSLYIGKSASRYCCSYQMSWFQLYPIKYLVLFSSLLFYNDNNREYSINRILRKLKLFHHRSIRLTRTVGTLIIEATTIIWLYFKLMSLMWRASCVFLFKHFF